MAAPRSWIVPLAVLALGGVAAVAWPLGGREGGAVAPERAAAAPQAERGREDGVAGGAQAERVKVARPEAEVAADAPTAAEVDAASEPAAETWALWGVVLREADDAPLPGLEVSLYTGTSVRTDATGRFEIELDAARFVRGEPARVVVIHPEGVVLSQDEHALAPGMVVRVDDGLEVLHGRVVDADGAPVVADDVSAACRLDAETLTFLGRSRGCDDDGGFRIPVAAAALRCSEAELKVWVGGTLFPADASLAALRSAEGARVVLDLCALRFEVRAADGEPLDEPTLRAVAWRPGGERARVLAFPELDEHGDVEILVERDVASVEVGAAAEGCAPWIEERPLPTCGSTWRIALPRLGPDDVLEGVVLDAGGQPVEGAFASCSPPARDDEWVAVPAIRGARTDAEGRFVLPFPVGRNARVRAFHRDHGSTGDELVQGGRRDLVLRFRAVARLDVSVLTPEGLGPGAELTRFALGLADGSWRTSTGPYGRTMFEEVPAGSHALVCVSGDGRWWGSFAVEVYDAGPQEVQRTLAPARWATGTLVDGAGGALAGVEVRRLGAPELPAPWSPFAVESGEDGRFRVLLGSDAAGELAFARAGVELSRLRVAEGDAGAVVLPSDG